jgi:hypothetical protein
MKTLNELMESKNEKVKLQAVMRISEILLEHDRSIERIAIADRKASLTARAETPVDPAPAEPEPEPVDVEEERAREQLDAVFGDRNAAHGR